MMSSHKTKDVYVCQENSISDAAVKTLIGKLDLVQKTAANVGSGIPNVNTWKDLHLTSDLLRNSGGLFGSWLGSKTTSWWHSICEGRWELAD